MEFSLLKCLVWRWIWIATGNKPLFEELWRAELTFVILKLASQKKVRSLASQVYCILYNPIKKKKTLMKIPHYTKDDTDTLRLFWIIRRLHTLQVPVTPGRLLQSLSVNLTSTYTLWAPDLGIQSVLSQLFWLGCKTLHTWYVLMGMFFSSMMLTSSHCKSTTPRLVSAAV